MLMIKGGIYNYEQVHVHRRRKRKNDSCGISSEETVHNW